MAKLFEVKKVKLGGVVFVIRKITPASIIGTDIMLPFTRYTEKQDSTPSDFDVDDYKRRVRKIIEASLIYVQRWFDKKPITKEIVDDIMATEELYSALFVEVFSFSLGVKKKGLSPFRSIENMRPRFTGWPKPMAGCLLKYLH